jgi:acetyl-CoA C-acetyltransferase
MGHVIQAGVSQNSARQSAIFADLPVSVGAITVNKVCASGMAAVMWAAQGIKLGDWDVVVAGGMENMTMAPYLLPKARQGYRYGNGELVDATYNDGLYDIYNDFSMGMTGEIVADRFNITREEMDAFAFRSHQLAVKAQNEGKFDEEIVPVEIEIRKKGKVMISKDEGPRPDTSLEKLAQLAPTFKEGGMVTAGNASPLNDGASAIVVMSEEVAREKGIPILAKIVDYGSHATRPEWVMEAPIEGTRKLLNKTGYTLNDIDLVEHNEAFACASCAVQNSLEIPDEKFNIQNSNNPLLCAQRSWKAARTSYHLFRWWGSAHNDSRKIIRLARRFTSPEYIFDKFLYSNTYQNLLTYSTQPHF